MDEKKGSNLTIFQLASLSIQFGLLGPCLSMLTFFDSVSTGFDGYIYFAIVDALLFFIAFMVVEKSYVKRGINKSPIALSICISLSLTLIAASFVGYGYYKVYVENNLGGFIWVLEKALKYFLGWVLFAVLSYPWLVDKHITSRSIRKP